MHPALIWNSSNIDYVEINIFFIHCISWETKKLLEWMLVENLKGHLENLKVGVCKMKSPKSLIEENIVPSLRTSSLIQYISLSISYQSVVHIWKFLDISIFTEIKIYQVEFIGEA